MPSGFSRKYGCLGHTHTHKTTAFKKGYRLDFVLVCCNHCSLILDFHCVPSYDKCTTCKIVRTLFSLYTQKQSNLNNKTSFCDEIFAWFLMTFSSNLYNY